MLNVEIMDKIYLNYEILPTKIWNMNPEIFLKDEIWALNFESAGSQLAILLPWTEVCKVTIWNFVESPLKFFLKDEN